MTASFRMRLVLAGVDEAGCGPLAGPVTAACVVLPPRYKNPDLADSKKLTPRERDALYPEIVSNAVAYAIVSVGPRRIDAWNIREATRIAHVLVMKRVARVVNPLHFLIDGHLPLETTLSYETIIKGDATVPLISAASILAKVTRDRLMGTLEKRYPGYGFEKHKGYGTKFHLQALAERGASPVHRRTFAGVPAFKAALSFQA